MGQQAIKTFFVTLRRSQIGKPWFHRKVLDGLGLKKRLTCVEKPNNPVIRGMLRKVTHSMMDPLTETGAHMLAVLGKVACNIHSLPALLHCVEPAGPLPAPVWCTDGHALRRHIVRQPGG